MTTSNNIFHYQSCGCKSLETSWFISNIKLINLGSPGLLLPLCLLELFVAMIVYFSRFFLLIIIETFIKTGVISYLKLLNLLINKKKPINLENPALLLLPAWIFVYSIFAIFSSLITIKTFIKTVVVSYLK